MSSVTSFFACSIFPFDSARMLLFTMSCARSDAVPTTSIDPHTLSISSVLRPAPAGIANVFSIFSCSRSANPCSSLSISISSCSGPVSTSTSTSGSSRSMSISMSGSSTSTSISAAVSMSLSASTSIAKSISGSSLSTLTRTERRSSCCTDATARFSGVLRTACPGSASKAIPDISTESKYVLLMLSSSVQLADRPIRTLPHRRIQIGSLPQLLQPRGRLGIPPLHQLIDQSNLHQWRLLLLQSVYHRFLHLRLPRMTAQRVQRRQPHIHARVMPQRVRQRRKHLRIETFFPPRPRNAFQPLARRLLLQHRKRHHLPHIGQLRVHRRQILRIRFCISTWQSQERPQCDAPSHRSHRRAQPLEYVPN